MREVGDCLCTCRCVPFGSVKDEAGVCVGGGGGGSITSLTDCCLSRLCKWWSANFATLLSHILFPSLFPSFPFLTQHYVELLRLPHNSMDLQVVHVL